MIENGLVVVLNKSVLNVTSKDLGLENYIALNNKMKVYYARNYIEASGILLLLREGICFDSLIRPIDHLSSI